MEYTIASVVLICLIVQIWAAYWLIIYRLDNMTDRLEQKINESIEYGKGPGLV